MLSFIPADHQQALKSSFTLLEGLSVSLKKILVSLEALRGFLLPIFLPSLQLAHTLDTFRICSASATLLCLDRCVSVLGVVLLPPARTLVR
jgi:hypothetical protein